VDEEGSLGSSLGPEERKELAFGLLRDWWMAATQALVDEVGSEVALKHLRPYFVNTGVAGARNIQEILGVDAEELIHLRTPIFFYQLVTGYRKLRFFQADDGSYIWEFVGCATGGNCKEACLSLCEFTPDAYMGELRHDSEAMLLSSLSYGNPSCQMLYKPKGREQEVSDSEEFELKADEAPAPPDDELKEYLALSFIGEAWSNATRALIDSLGSEMALEKLGPYMRHSGLSFGIRMSNPSDSKEKGLQSVQEIVAFVQVLHQRKGTCDTWEGGAKGQVVECPFSSSPPEICAQYEAFFNGICEALDPAFEFAYDRMMSRGYADCHWTLRKKAGGADRTETSMEGEDEESLRILRRRFARGEINEEEYRRSRDVLLER